MNHTLKQYVLLAVGALGVAPALAMTTSTPSQTFGRTFFQQRDTTSNTARELIGVTEYLVPCDSDCLNGFATITPQYERSFDRDKIGKYFFYNGTNVMTFGAAGGAGVDVFGRYFFLNDNFNGTVTALPRVENFNLDFRLRLNLDSWLCGLYFDIHAPLTWTRWAMNLDNTTVTSKGTTIDAFAFGNAVATASPVTSITQAYNGQTLNTTAFPDLQKPLQYGRVDDSSSSGRKSRTRLADIELAIGWNFWCDECYHLGVDIRTILPTGNRPNAEFLFEPIAGNGKHFELGGGVSGHYEFWNNGCDSSFSVWMQANVYHVFRARQRRIFDLQNADGTQRIGSSRLTIKRFSSPTTYAGEILFGPNVLALECKVKNDVHSDLSVMFDYQRCGFNFDAGYNFWVWTKDKISNIDDIPANTFAVQGLTLGTGGANANRTGSTANINGTGGAADGASAADNVFIRNADLSVVSAVHPTAMTHKFFAGVTYAWMHCDYSPFLNLSGSVEFSGRRNNALDLWSVWLKGGFAFS